MTIKDLFYYDPESPSCLRWVTNRYSGKSFNRLMAAKDSAAGTLEKKTGYWKVKVDGKVMMAHRVIWEILTGDKLEPKIKLDHIDRNTSNNKIENLRLATQKVNCQNKSKYKNNKTGVTGVFYRTSTKTNSSPKYSAIWYNTEGKQMSKSFSVSIYGDELARFLAEEVRDIEIQKLNLTGQNYTSTHGGINEH